jgi:hypothetical protein
MNATTFHLITDSLVVLAEHSTRLIPLLQTLAVIVALVVVGMAVWKGKP